MFVSGLMNSKSAHMDLEGSLDYGDDIYVSIRGVLKALWSWYEGMWSIDSVTGRARKLEGSCLSYMIHV